MIVPTPLTPEAREYWSEFLDRRPLEELEYAFGEWTRSSTDPPKPRDIDKLIHEFRLSKVKSPMEEFRETRAQGEREGKMATDQDYDAMNAVIEKIGKEDPKTFKDMKKVVGKVEFREAEEERAVNLDLFNVCEPNQYPASDPRHISGMLPTTAELVDKIQRSGVIKYIPPRKKKSKGA